MNISHSHPTFTASRRLGALATTAILAVVISGCESNPSTADAKAAAAAAQAKPADEQCFVTGSNLRQRECRSAAVRTLGKEDVERIQSQSLVIPLPKN